MLPTCQEDPARFVRTAPDCEQDLEGSAPFLHDNLPLLRLCVLFEPNPILQRRRLTKRNVLGVVDGCAVLCPFPVLFRLRGCTTCRLLFIALCFVPFQFSFDEPVTRMCGSGA